MPFCFGHPGPPLSQSESVESESVESESAESESAEPAEPELESLELCEPLEAHESSEHEDSSGTPAL